MNSNKKIWFPAKKYGWGWSFPCSWEGWVVLLIYILAAALGGIIFAHLIGLFFLYMMGISGLFFAIVWLKGEKPRWRWGDDK